MGKPVIEMLMSSAWPGSWLGVAIVGSPRNYPFVSGVFIRHDLLIDV